MKAILPILCTCLAAGCCSEGDVACKREEATSQASRYVSESAPKAEVPIEDHPRVVVTRIDVVADSTAYSGRRGVYVIKDTVTGREFIGVAGVGISEVGDHQSGKVRVQDER